MWFNCPGYIDEITKDQKLCRRLRIGDILHIHILDPDTQKPISFYALVLDKEQKNGKIIPYFTFDVFNDLIALEELEEQVEGRLLLPIPGFNDTLDTFEQFAAERGFQLHISFDPKSTLPPASKSWWGAWFTDLYGHDVWYPKNVTAYGKSPLLAAFILCYQWDFCSRVSQ